ncbi:hypothetical protein WS62_19390 [Burkholderia sp. ABCPW 14]|uniref:Uncharacterized protein n=1 Tax=Burkholderia mayonis TaxID=1385591 RepID=A0A1B4FS76_9BURK|nr:hypothetical protein WS71_03555 [Burkholderia mayonis]KVD86600.1 hypothetical protein WS62_19390 [Burkholderia sp. ABCPW 14]KVE51275.1 hypothetical protein WS71_13285 [Burkholderia mayonis]
MYVPVMAPVPVTEAICMVEPSSLSHEPVGFWQFGAVEVSAHAGDAKVPSIASDTSIFFIFSSFFVMVRISCIGEAMLWLTSHPIRHAYCASSTDDIW